MNKSIKSVNRMRVQQEGTSQLSAPNMPGLGTSLDLVKYTNSEKKCIEMYWKPSKATDLTEHTEVIENVRDVKKDLMWGGKSDVVA